jgi:hypothetical protein
VPCAVVTPPEGGAMRSRNEAARAGNNRDLVANIVNLLSSV